jgi:hypothetical protein
MTVHTKHRKSHLVLVHYIVSTSKDRKHETNECAVQSLLVMGRIFTNVFSVITF